MAGHRPAVARTDPRGRSPGDVYGEDLLDLRDQIIRQVNLQQPDSG
jgi:hypothetical protein